MVGFLRDRQFKIKPFEALIRGFALTYDLRTELVAAIILQESSGNQWAYRYEPAFFTKYIQNKTRLQLGGTWDIGISKESELRLRACSFGLMQIMGQTAREEGFDKFLPELFCPEENINIGCKILRKNLNIFDGNQSLAVSAYNAGVARVKREGVTSYYPKVINQLDKVDSLITI